VGLKNLKHAPTYTSSKNLKNGNFVFMRPHDPIFILVQMGRTQSDVAKDDQNENFKMVKGLMVGFSE
jgi:hypothetical protein